MESVYTMLRSKILICGVLVGAITGCSQHYLVSLETSDLLHESARNIAVYARGGDEKTSWMNGAPLLEGRCDVDLFEQTEHRVSVLDEELNVEPVTSPLSLWSRMRLGFSLTDYEHPEVQKNIKWFTDRPLHMERLVKQAKPYLYYIVDEIEKREMPLEIALLPAIESAYQPLARSHLSATGLWQFMPATARHYGLKMDWWHDERRDVQASTQAALNYLQKLHKTFDGDWLLALAAYNAGQGNVRKALRENRRKEKELNFWALNLPTETKKYIPKLLALSTIIYEPDFYEVNLIDIENSRYFSEVKIEGQIDLALVASLSEISLEQVRALNPAFKRWATRPGSQYDLLLPVNKIEIFKENLATIPKEQHVRWAQHKVRSGETLGHIAQKYQIDTSLLRQVNHLKSSKIRVGKLLMVPINVQAGHDGEKSHKVIHVVSRGDTLWDLAKAYKVSISKIVDWNKLSKKSILSLGQRVVVWVKPNRV